MNIFPASSAATASSATAVAHSVPHSAWQKPKGKTNPLDQQVSNVARHIMQREAMGANTGRWVQDVLYPANVRSKTYKQLDLGSMRQGGMEGPGEIFEYQQFGRNTVALRGDGSSVYIYSEPDGLEIQGGHPKLELWEGTERLWNVLASEGANGLAILHIDGDKVFALEQLTGWLYIYDKATGKRLGSECLKNWCFSLRTSFAPKREAIIAGGKIFAPKNEDGIGWRVLQWDLQRKEKWIGPIPEMDSKTSFSLWVKDGYLLSLDMWPQQTCNDVVTVKWRVHRIEDGRTFSFRDPMFQLTHDNFQKCVAFDKENLIFVTNVQWSYGRFGSVVHIIDLNKNTNRSYNIPMPHLDRQVTCLCAADGQIYLGFNTGLVAKIDTATSDPLASFQIFGIAQCCVNQMSLDGNVLLTSDDHTGANHCYWDKRTGTFLRKERRIPSCCDTGLFLPHETVLNHGVLSSDDLYRNVVIRDYCVLQSDKNDLVVEEEEEKASACP